MGTAEDPGRQPSAEPQVSDLTEMVSYQDGTVVSRTLVKKPAATLTLFAFDEGESLSEHTAPFDAWVYVLEGTVEIRISGKPYVVGPGQTITMPADEPHGLTAKTRFKMLLAMVRS